jgi:hypothetical protein
MKYLRYIVITMAVCSLNAQANITSHDSTVISSEYHKNIPMPKWLKEEFDKHPDGLNNNKKKTNVAYLQAIAYGANLLAPVLIELEGDINGDIYNDTKENQSYKLDEYVCVLDKCSNRQTTIQLLPGAVHHHNDELYVTFQTNQPGEYKNKTYCKMSGTEEEEIIDYATVTVV